MNIPIESGKDGWAISVAIPVPDLPKLRLEHKDHFPHGRHETAPIPSEVYSEYLTATVRSAMLAEYAKHLETLRLTLSNPEQFKIEAPHSGAVAIKRRYESVIIIALTGTGYYSRGLTLQRLSVQPLRDYGGFGGKRRDYDLSLSGRHEAVQALAKGEATSVTVTSNWSKAWAATTKLLTDRLAFDEERERQRTAQQVREQKRSNAALPVNVALAQVSSKPGDGTRPNYAYDAKFVTNEHWEGSEVASYTFTVTLGDVGVKLPPSLARHIVNELQGTGANIELTISNLKDHEAVKVLGLLPQTQLVEESK